MSRETRQIVLLKQHPKQAAMFADLPEGPLQALADDIRSKGLQHPVEILPDNTIICGHQRVRAATLLGWDEIAVIVRDDLAAKGEAAVEEWLIADNLQRRQLDKLEVARCYQRLKEIGRAEWMADRRTGDEVMAGDLRDILGKRYDL